MALDPRAAMHAAIAVPGVPRDVDGPIFREPWEAQAFAMALALHEKGLFTWKEWAAALADEIKRAQAAGDPDTGETYYQHWLATLENLVAECVLGARHLEGAAHTSASPRWDIRGGALHRRGREGFERPAFVHDVDGEQLFFVDISGDGTHRITGRSRRSVPHER